MNVWEFSVPPCILCIWLLFCLLYLSLLFSLLFFPFFFWTELSWKLIKNVYLNRGPNKLMLQCPSLLHQMYMLFINWMYFICDNKLLLNLNLNTTAILQTGHFSTAVIWQSLIVCSYNDLGQIKGIIWCLNALSPGRCGSNFISVISVPIFQIKFMSTPCEIALMCMPQNPFYDTSTLVQIMAWWQCSKLNQKNCQSCCLEFQIINIKLKKSLRKVTSPPPKLSASGWRTGSNLKHWWWWETTSHTGPNIQPDLCLDMALLGHNKSNFTKVWAWDKFINLVCRHEYRNFSIGT